jgi:hypothetical protein
MLRLSRGVTLKNEDKDSPQWEMETKEKFVVHKRQTLKTTENGNIF